LVALVGCNNSSSSSSEESSDSRSVSPSIEAGPIALRRLTTRQSFLTRELGRLYQVPVVTAQGFEPHLFDESLPGGRIKPGLHVAGNASQTTRVGLTIQRVMGRTVEQCGEGSMETTLPIGEILGL